ncbi:hypothetical protein CORC01_02191 [Colletotrichum orchidophilum]|uniref:Uncharacterized protein n=1 Tax=Colletotrichum orchidophilum TaxID=1209926 RepID=A0A1G4BMG4_9PEZI|nr:uncharacterized protein CORC01_02191 [Colletotrichum orchidophilum]OHF02496.1 hypothetical protein CORC01_02191 [Colletotrichum orchidophilum]
MVSPMGTLRRRATRRPNYRRDDLKIDIRDDKGEISSDDEDSPSPKSTKFPPGARPTAPPPPPPPPGVVSPPAVLNPANPTDSESSTSSDSPSPTSSDFPRPTGPPRGPQHGETGPAPFSSTISTTTGASSSTRTLPTAVPNSRSTTSFDSQPTGGTTGGSRGGNEMGLGNDRSYDIGWTPTAIAFGTIAIAALFLVIGVGIWWCLRYQKRRKARHLDERSISPDGQHYWDPSSTFSPPTMPAARPSRRSPSSIFAELMGHAYAAENGTAGPGTYATNDRNSLTPQGYLDEKTYDPARQLPVLEPAPVAQPNVRNSIASWIRRHHPLKLNPMSGRSSVYSTRSAVRASTNTVNVNAPPVPVLSDAYRGTDPVEQSGLAPPSQQRYAPSSQDDTESPLTEYNTDSFLSLYQTQQVPQQQPGQHQQEPGQLQQHQQLPAAPWLQDPPPVVFGERGVSMTPTEATESTWQSWGGGVNQPQHHDQHQTPPDTPRKGWIEKCIKFGGLK